MADSAPAFYADLYAHLRKANMEMLAYVPDEALGPILDSAESDNAVRTVVMTTEEEGVAVCCGAALVNKRAVMMMQSSGVGNCVNAFTLIQNCRIPFLALIAMRGEFGETNSWQYAMGATTAQTLELAGFRVLWARDPAEVGKIVDAAADMAWRGNQAVAILLSQQLVGAKQL